MDRRAFACAAFAVLAASTACNRPAPNAPASATEVSASLVDPYLRVGNALASDSIEGVQADAQQIRDDGERQLRRRVLSLEGLR